MADTHTLRWPAWARTSIARVREAVPRESRVLLVALGIVVSLWVFFAMASAMSTGRSQAFDEGVLRAFRRADDPAAPIGPYWFRTAAAELTALGSFPVLLVFILVAAGYLVIERRFAMLGLVLVASIGGMALNPVLKDLFARPRPTVVPQLAIVTSSSFPSGHAMSAAVVYLTLGALLARTTTRWRLRLYYLGVALALSFVVGLSRMYLGVHYPTDVVAGWTAGMLWALLCELVAQMLQRRGVVNPPSR